MGKLGQERRAAPELIGGALDIAAEDLLSGVEALPIASCFANVDRRQPAQGADGVIQLGWR